VTYGGIGSPTLSVVYIETGLFLFQNETKSQTKHQPFLACVEQWLEVAICIDYSCPCLCWDFTHWLGTRSLGFSSAFHHRPNDRQIDRQTDRKKDRYYSSVNGEVW